MLCVYVLYRCCAHGMACGVWIVCVCVVYVECMVCGVFTCGVVYVLVASHRRTCCSACVVMIACDVCVV